jgi:hypothetical protein
MQKRASRFGGRWRGHAALVGLGLLCSAGLTIGGAVRGDFAASSQVGPCVPPAGDSSV